MKNYLFVLLSLLSLNLFAQKDCEYSTNIKDSLGVYKVTNEYLVSEKNFGGKKDYIFYSLITDNGVPMLNLQIIQKSKGFIPANCFNEKSKLYLQLSNNKIVTLLHIQKESCGSLIRDDKGFDNRVSVGTFMFIKGSFEDLKSSKVNLMRIQHLTNTEDYVVKSQIVSEMDQKVYNPDSYFINYLKCVQ